MNCINSLPVGTMVQSKEGPGVIYRYKRAMIIGIDWRVRQKEGVETTYPVYTLQICDADNIDCKDKIIENVHYTYFFPC